MRIISTANKMSPRHQATRSPEKLKIQPFLFVFLSLIIISGCSQDPKRAQESVRQSQQYYQRAVKQYKDLIAQGKDTDRLHFELGRLYFEHGDFDLAVREFKASGEREARKLLAISYYKQGNYIDALEIFNKDELADDQYQYFHGLTAEKLNLFDQALKAYAGIKSPEFRPKAEGRIRAIERKDPAKNIKDLDPMICEKINKAPPAKDYPQAGALLVFLDESITITAENTEETELHHLIKVLNERGKEDFSETQIGYDSTFEKIELVFARTIKPDGTVVDVGTRHIRDVSKYLNFPLYSNARVYIISFPEIAEGACIEYKVRILRNRLINKKDFVAVYPVQSSEPLIAANFTVKTPKSRVLKQKTLNERYNDFGASLTPKVKEENAERIYRWEFGNVPEIIPESNMPARSEINPSILLSTFGSWQEIYDWWWSLAADKIKADSAIKEKVRELTRDKATDEEKARAIYNFCAQKIRYVAVEYGQAGYEPHPAGDIFRNKYGDCKDQAVLLITMLKEAGLAAWPVLIATKEHYNLNPDFPSMLFNHAIACVELNGKTVFLDPTAQTCPFGDLPQPDQGRRVLVFKEKSFEILPAPLFPAEHNLVRNSLKIKVKPDESISAERSILTTGFFGQGQRYWLLFTQPEQVRELLDSRAQEISIGAKLEEYRTENLEDLNKPVILSYYFNGPEYFTSAGKLRIAPALAAADTSSVTREKRKYALDFDCPEARETEVQIELPQGYKVKYMPESVSSDTAWFRFSAKYSQEKNRIIFSQREELKKPLIEVAEYPEFKKRLEALAKSLKQRIILERTQ
ncbi:MAG: DUF3857 domain-containing protein [Candidatus Omnitrophica bacterium]|nr:DUF3857 domain-containing protein [Candidatus Omnitrophota bacterium]